jgi:hypothetical protein
MKIVGTINEIGDSARPFPYSMDIHPLQKLKGILPAVLIAKFKTDKGFNYIVDINVGDNELYVDFSLARGHNKYDVVNQGLEQAFKVMATVVAIAKEVVDIAWKKYKHPVYTIEFSLATEGATGKDASVKKGNQRMKLYAAFIKKAIPGAKITGTDDIIVMVPDGYYK